jgi:hypothetical protein
VPRDQSGLKTLAVSTDLQGAKVFPAGGESPRRTSVSLVRASETLAPTKVRASETLVRASETLASTKVRASETLVWASETLVWASETLAPTKVRASETLALRKTGQARRLPYETERHRRK